MLRYTFTIILLLAPAADAALYKWVDDEGVTRYTTTLPPESAQHERKVITKQGRTLKTYSGARTSEQKAEDERRQAEQERKARAVIAAKKRDRALQVSYHTIADIEAKRENKFHALDNQIKTLEKGFNKSQKEYSGLVATAIQQERSGKMPSETLKAEYRSAKREFDDYETRLAKIRQDRINLSQAFDDDIQRFKELKGIE